MKYYKVIQQHYGTTWEDVSLYPCNSKFEPIEKSGVFNKRGFETSLLSEDLKGYNEFGQYPTRVISRRVKC